MSVTSERRLHWRTGRTRKPRAPLARRCVAGLRARAHRRLPDLVDACLVPRPPRPQEFSAPETTIISVLVLIGAVFFTVSLRPRDEQPGAAVAGVVDAEDSAGVTTPGAGSPLGSVTYPETGRFGIT